MNPEPSNAVCKVRRDLSIKRGLRAKKLAGDQPTAARSSEEGGAKCISDGAYRVAGLLREDEMTILCYDRMLRTMGIRVLRSERRPNKD